MVLRCFQKKPASIRERLPNCCLTAALWNKLESKDRVRWATCKLARRIISVETPRVVRKEIMENVLRTFSCLNFAKNHDFQSQWSTLVLHSWFYLTGAGSSRSSQTKSKRAVKWFCVCVCCVWVSQISTLKKNPNKIVSKGIPGCHTRILWWPKNHSNVFNSSTFSIYMLSK